MLLLVTSSAFPIPEVVSLSIHMMYSTEVSAMKQIEGGEERGMDVMLCKHVLERYTLNNVNQ